MENAPGSHMPAGRAQRGGLTKEGEVEESSAGCKVRLFEVSILMNIM